jgi:hypothetical protein
MLTFNQFTNYMAGLPASVVHDYICEQFILTSKERVDLFAEALTTLKVNKYDKLILTTGVRLGSYLGYCDEPPANP